MASCLPPFRRCEHWHQVRPWRGGPAEADIDFDIIKNDNDTFTVKYTPPGAGRYTIMVLFANQVPCAWVLVINPNLTPLPDPSQQLERLSSGDNSIAPD